MVRVSQVIRLSRLMDAMYPTVSVVLGAAMAGTLDRVYYIPLLLTIVVVTVLNSMAMVWNDIEDRRIDALNDRSEVSEYTQHDIKQLIGYIVLLSIVAVVMAAMVNIQTVTMSCITILLIWLYNSRPYQASRRPISSVVLLSGTGAFIPYLFGVAVVGLSWNMVVIGLFLWIGRISLSVLKDYKDVRGDVAYKKRTFLLCFGVQWVARLSLASLIIGYGGFASFIAWHTQEWWQLFPTGLGIVILAYMRLGLFDRRASYGRLDKLFRRIAQYQILLDAGFVVWLMQ